ncbi:unnamed protein product [Linum trigynum]|uniref:Uncharacterized protein n=1 Tax=Linum trigynum TaxID=586398 RepID=A0AAV2E1F6_9ROSI
MRRLLGAGGGGGWTERWSAGRRRRPGARAGDCSAGGGTLGSGSTRAGAAAALMTPDGWSPSRYSTPRSSWSTNFWLYSVSTRKGVVLPTLVHRAKSTWKCWAILVMRPPYVWCPLCSAPGTGRKKW